MFTYQGINYSVIANKEYSVSVGSGSDIGPNAVASSFGPNVTIPSSVLYQNHLYKVLEIGKNAFFECRQIKYLQIPASVEVIRMRAFYRIINCEEVVFCNNSRLMVIETQGFYDLYKAKSIIFTGDCLRSIGYMALCYAINGLTTITIPSSVSSIDKSAFAGINNLKHFYYCGNHVLSEDIFFAESSQQTPHSLEIHVTKNYPSLMLGNRNITDREVGDKCHPPRNLCRPPLSWKFIRSYRRSTFLIVFVILSSK